MPDPKDDLARYAHNGCEDAFRRVIDHYGALVLNTARRRVHEAGLAEELAQNVFVLLARKAGKVSGYRSVSAWLFETTRLEAAKLLRGQFRHRRRVEAFAHESQGQAMTDDNELRNLLPNLEEALDSLKAIERQILLSRFFDEQSFREIASSTGKSESACKMALSRALEKLRRKLQARGISVTVITLGTFLQTEWARSAPITTLSSLAGSVIRPAPVGAAISKTIMTISPYKILLFSVVALLIGACFTLTPNEEPPQSNEFHAEVGNEKENRIQRIGDSSTRLRARRSSGEKVEEVPHEVKDLPGFYLPSMTLENTNLAEAMDHLIDQYQEVCRDTGEVALPISWELEGKARAIEKLNLSGGLMSNFRLIALFSGTSVEVDGHRLVFKEIQDGPRRVQEWSVPPTFDRFGRDLISKAVEVTEVFEDVDAERITLPGDLPPVSDQGTVPIKVSADYGEFFRSVGFLGEEETLKLFVGSGRLRAEAGARHLAMIDAVVGEAAIEMPIQIRFFPRKTFNGEFEQLPTVVARPGQTATLEMGKEYIDRDLVDGAPVVAWVGLRLELEAELYGFGERTKVTYAYIQQPAEGAQELFEETGKLDDLELEEFRVDEQVVFRSSNERLNNLPEEFLGADSEGNQLGVSFFSERIDATGRRLISRDNLKFE